MKKTVYVCAFTLSMFYLAFGEDVIVKIAQGLLRGKSRLTQDYETNMYYSFKGIPYAEPPTDHRRFQEPRTPYTWDDIREARKKGSECLQYKIIEDKFGGSEDCLFLNVYTPTVTSHDGSTKVKTLLPVMVLLTSYVFLNEDETHYGHPDFLVSKDVVVVSVNHRLDVLGFLNLGIKEIPGNAGMKDQVAALKWVQKNIEVFGGNPKSVTLVGHSSGAASAILHTMSPMSAGLFHRVVAMSGIPSFDIFYPFYVKEKSHMLLKLLGYDVTDTNNTLELLKLAPAESFFYRGATILASEPDVFFKKLAHFVPDVEEDFGQTRFLVRSAAEAFKNGKVRPVDIMFSYSNQEAGLAMIIRDMMENGIEQCNRYIEMFVPSKISLYANSNTILELGKKIKKHYFGGNDVTLSDIGAFVNFVNIAVMVVEVHKYIEMWPKSAKTYLFKFSSHSPTSGLGESLESLGITGAVHGSILNYVLNRGIGWAPLPGSKDYIMVEQLNKALTNFAKYGEPSPKGVLGVKWPQYRNKKEYAEFTDNITIHKAPYKEDLAFWKKIYDSLKIKFPF